MSSLILKHLQTLQAMVVKIHSHAPTAMHQ
nr:MAG TPA: hypothetical protein [Caudoviricetes sp.]